LYFVLVIKKSTGFLESSLLLLILLIWLGVVSLLIIIILICLCCLYCRKRKEPRKLPKRDEKYGQSNRNNLVARYDSVELDREENAARKQNGSGTTTGNGTLGGLQRVDSKPEWMSSMKEDTFQEYSIDTIEREPSSAGLKDLDTSRTYPIPEPDYSVPDYSTRQSHTNGALSHEDLIAY
jgi:Ca2+/Na+ antiporter